LLTAYRTNCTVSRCIFGNSSTIWLAQRTSYRLFSPSLSICLGNRSFAHIAAGVIRLSVL
jgi:hypothetical protein